MPVASEKYLLRMNALPPNNGDYAQVHESATDREIVKEGFTFLTKKCLLFAIAITFFLKADNFVIKVLRILSSFQ